MRFCSPELRFISLKHPLARHSTICSVRRKTHLAVCFRGTWRAPCGGCPSPTRLQSWWLSPPSPPVWRVALQGGPPGVAWRINSGRSECRGPLGMARNSRGRGLTAGPGNGDAQATSRALVSSCPSASCSLAEFGCHPLQELGGLAKESGLGLNSAQPFHVPLCTCVWLTHDNGRSCGLGPRGSSRAAAWCIL